jgi:phospholipase/lecithinase/hemolysin
MPPSWRITISSIFNFFHFSLCSKYLGLPFSFFTQHSFSRLILHSNFTFFQIIFQQVKMRSTVILFAFSLFSSTIARALGRPIQQQSSPSIQKRSPPYPFNQIVAFGDEMSDNGNGSYAHGISGSPATVYGFGTWTNGPVAVSYLANLLGIGDTYTGGTQTLRNYAFGGCCGGGSFGATLFEGYTPSPAGSPSLTRQIQNYTSSTHYNIPSTLQFIWVGQNDLSKHTDAFWLGDPSNAAFADAYTFGTVSAVETLISAGAPYVFVANLYPKHLAPVTKAYLCGTSAACVNTWGQIIQNANAALEAGLRQFGKKVIYYDVYTFMTGLIENAPSHGFTQALTSFCDGDGNASWDLCMEQGRGGEFFWMNWEQMTTAVHELIAVDMKGAIDRHFGI